MKKILLLLCLFPFCTSISTAIENYNETFSNLVINSELNQSNFSVITYENSNLLPLNKLFDLLNIKNLIKFQSNTKTLISTEKLQLEIYPNSYAAYINSQKVSLITPVISYNKDLYLSIELLNDILNFYIHYDNTSNTIFINKLLEFRQMEFFFNKAQKQLQNINNMNMDIVTELISPDGSSYSIGSNIYIDKTLNKIFQKNMLNQDWTESNITLSKKIDTNFNNAFFTGISLDRLNSTPDCLIFYGYHPLDINKLSYTKLFINPNTLLIEKQLNEFMFENTNVKQTIFFSYN